MVRHSFFKLPGLAIPATVCGFAFLLLLIGTTPRFSYAQPGELTGFSFLRIEPSARAASLGGSFSAMYGNDANAMFYNPALLNDQMHRALSVSFVNHVSDLRASFIAFGLHQDPIGSMGVGIRFLNWGSLTETDEQGNELGSFSSNDLAITLGASRVYADRVRLGGQPPFNPYLSRFIPVFGVGTRSGHVIPLC